MPYADIIQRREYHKSYMKKYREAEDVKLKDSSTNKIYRAKNTVRLRTVLYRWREDNIDSYRRIKRRSGFRRHQQKKTELAGIKIVNAVIEMFYDFRDICTQITGEEHHVDHRIALARGEQHVPWNLEVLTAKANLKNGLIYAKSQEKAGHAADN